MSIAVLTLFVGALVTAWAARFGRLTAAWTAAGIVLLTVLQLLPYIPSLFDFKTGVEPLPWVPGAGLSFSFRMDGLGMLFASLILVIGVLVILYARFYLSSRDSVGRFYSYLLLFMGAMLGVVLSENLIQLLIFWELTSLSSFLLISYWKDRSDARQGARMALAITGAGGLAMLGGIVLLGEAVGSYELSVILSSGDLVRAHPHYLAILVLILLGAFTKSAQFPFHFWLPNAMAAPTPVSAYLHSATMVKAGIFLLARLFPVLSDTDEWSLLVGSIGLATFVLGAVLALFKHDLKGLLAYSTISHLGLIVLVFGIGTPLAAVAGLFHIINHATFKASLFMAAGIIDHETGSRDMRRLNGLWKQMPHTALLAMVAAASMAGVPLFNGFISKEMFFAEAVGAVTHMHFGWLLPVAVTVAGIFAVAYSLRFIHDVFFNGEPVNLPKAPHEPPRWMKVPMEFLVVLCLLVGIFPAYIVQPALDVAAAGMLLGPPPAYDLALWHGFSPALAMSGVALLGGLLIYAVRNPLFRLHERWEHVEGKVFFDWLLQGLFALAGRITRGMDNRSLPRMLTLLVAFAVVLGGTGFLRGGGVLTGDRPLLPVDGISLLGAACLLIAALATVFMRACRFTALIVIGVVGLLVALVFVKFSGPDLALTQLSVEVVTVILLLLALYFLPQRETAVESGRRRLFDAGLALLAGAGTGALAWAVMTRPYQSISDYFLANSVSGGGGSNVVNVILVDFRGYDTLGEVTVLALAALGIYAMLDGLQLSGPSLDPQGRAWSADKHPTVMAAFTRLLLPLALLVSVFIFLRGHNLPGGGFIAGLITAVALLMQYLGNGVRWTQARIPANMHPLIAVGLLIAVLTGLASWLFGYPFLTSTFSHVHWPLVGEFELASAMAFDLGVYLVVVGATMLILVYLGLMHSLRQRSNKPKEER